MTITEYRGVYARNPRRTMMDLQRGGPTRHIAGYDGTPDGRNIRAPRMDDKSLCGVFVAWYPESGEQGRPGNATCKACLAKWRALECMSVWQSPSGRLHWLRRCSGGMRGARRVTVSREQLEAGRFDTTKVCPCLKRVEFTPGRKAKS